MARFTRAELAVMRILWEDGELKPAAIQERFPRPIKNSALRAILSVLVTKGHVIRERKGRAYYYRPQTKKESAFKAMYREMLNVFCGGSSEALICHILKSETISRDELIGLKRLAEEKIDEKEDDLGKKSRPTVK